MEEQIHSYSDVWEANWDTPEEAANLRIRPHLMMALTEYVETQTITQEEAGRRFGVPRSRVSELVNGKISKFSIYRLVNMASRVNMETQIVVKQGGQPVMEHSR